MVSGAPQGALPTAVTLHTWMTEIGTASSPPLTAALTAACTASSAFIPSSRLQMPTAKKAKRSVHKQVRQGKSREHTCLKTTLFAFAWEKARAANSVSNQRQQPHGPGSSQCSRMRRPSCPWLVLRQGPHQQFRMRTMGIMLKQHTPQ